MRSRWVNKSVREYSKGRHVVLCMKIKTTSRDRSDSFLLKGSRAGILGQVVAAIQALRCHLP